LSPHLRFICITKFNLKSTKIRIHEYIIYAWSSTLSFIAKRIFENEKEKNGIYDGEKKKINSQFKTQSNFFHSTVIRTKLRFIIILTLEIPLPFVLPCIGKKYQRRLKIYLTVVFIWWMWTHLSRWNANQTLKSTFPRWWSHIASRKPVLTIYMNIHKLYYNICFERTKTLGRQNTDRLKMCFMEINW